MEVAFGASVRPLVLNAASFASITSLQPSLISIISAHEPGRAAAEALVEHVYARKYGAVIGQHYPYLMCVHGTDGDVIATVGFRPAGDEPLFLEAYLDEPVEAALGRASGRAVPRAAIVEIGSLAAQANGASIFLFVTLAALLRHRGFSHAVVTATRPLRRAIEAFSFEMTTLAPADQSRLGDRAAAWGTYYANQPKIIAGTIEQAFSRLAPFLPPDRNPHLRELFAVAEFPNPESTQ